MLFPNNEDLQKTQLLYGRWINQTSSDPSVRYHKLGSEEIFRLIYAVSETELRNLRGRAVKRATSAAYVVSSQYLLATFGENFSQRRGIDVAIKWAYAEKFADGTPLLRDRKSIKKCLVEFKSCLHLWAAYSLNLSYGFWPTEKLWDRPEYVRRFLGLAGGILKLACESKPARSKVPILNKQDCLLFHESISQHAWQITPDRHPRPTQLFELLKDYKPTD